MHPAPAHATARDGSATDGAFSAAFVEALDALMAWRRDVRRFRRDPVDPALIDAVMDAVMDAAGAAPSVGLSEPWRFVFFESEAARDAVRASFARANAAELAAQDPDRAASYAALKLEGLREAPTQIAVFCDDETGQGRGLGAGAMPEARRYSVVCAIMQMWLAARARGLGLGWVSILEPEAVRAAAGAPPGWTLIAYLRLGWPEETHLDCDLERAGWEARRRLAGRITAI